MRGPLSRGALEYERFRPVVFKGRSHERERGTHEYVRHSLFRLIMED